MAAANDHVFAALGEKTNKLHNDDVSTCIPTGHHFTYTGQVRNSDTIQYTSKDDMQQQRANSNIQISQTNTLRYRSLWARARCLFAVHFTCNELSGGSRVHMLASETHTSDISHTSNPLYML